MDALSPVKEVSGKTFPIFLGVREIRESSLKGGATSSRPFLHAPPEFGGWKPALLPFFYRASAGPGRWGSFSLSSFLSGIDFPEESKLESDPRCPDRRLMADGAPPDGKPRSDSSSSLKAGNSVQSW